MLLDALKKRDEAISYLCEAIGYCVNNPENLDALGKIAKKYVNSRKS